MSEDTAMGGKFKDTLTLTALTCNVNYKKKVENY